MKESSLWDRIRSPLNREGKFQKISDRFTEGIPDVLGSHKGRSFAIELKEIEGVRILRAKFRPGQLDWLRDWEELGGGVSLVVASWKTSGIILPWRFGRELEEGTTPNRVIEVGGIWYSGHSAKKWVRLSEAILANHNRR